MDTKMISKMLTKIYSNQLKEESKNYPKVMQELHSTAIKMYQDENLARNS